MVRADGLSPSRHPIPGTWARSVRTLLRTTTRTDSTAKFSSWADPGSLAVPCWFLFLRLLICLNSGWPRLTWVLTAQTWFLSFCRCNHAGLLRNSVKAAGTAFFPLTATNTVVPPTLPLLMMRAAGQFSARHLPARHGGGDDAMTPSRRALGHKASGTTCVQRLNGSRDSAIHTKYRISLRSSSMQEPRYPLPRVV
ncbi:hypothetical protein ZIOFF_042319 [Zingiber officinale]|uniref:Uncharacterized protein n=1 Tax=Zingiber officinale TaxID=94328 RepID=A0A8J5KYN4_ZINOF|nr:hypothetical protein ZIOFF_042319 [Zingiber officinale]